MASSRAAKLVISTVSLASLALCVLMAWLWIRSFFISDAYVASTEPALVAYQSFRGAIHYVNVSPGRLSSSDQKHPPLGWSSTSAENALLWQEWNGPRPGSYTFFGFAYANSLNNFTIAAVPYWLGVALTAIVPIWSLPRVVRWLRRPEIRCPNCGAKTREITERCPRCGQPLLATGPPPPPTHDAPPPPRPSKRVQSTVVKTVKPQGASSPEGLSKPGRTHSPPTGGSDTTF